MNIKLINESFYDPQTGQIFEGTDTRLQIHQDRSREPYEIANEISSFRYLCRVFYDEGFIKNHVKKIMSDYGYNNWLCLKILLGK